MPIGGLPVNIVIAGMMGAGKTTVGREVARILGWEFLDLDDAVAGSAGRSVAAIFAEEGEPGFRRRERAAVADLTGATGRVIAAGGFTLGDPESAEVLGRLGTVVILTATPETLAARLAGERPRPPLAEPSAAGIALVLAARRAVYDRYPLQVATDGRTPAEVAARVAELAALPFPAVAVGVATPSGGYRVVIGDGALAGAGALLSALRPPSRVVVVTDGVVARHHLAPLVRSLTEVGFDVTSTILPTGEKAKTLAEVARLYDAFVAAGLQRLDIVVALGGGAVGDTAGFAAATYLRGVALVQVPTTILAMVDSSIGGKTGVNLPAGKNLVGAFHDPIVVLTDPALLATLPQALYDDGLAEALKAALIGDPALFAAMEAGATHPGVVLAPAVAVKARIVSADPREEASREVLNLGHTFAHAIETASAHGISHGRAVAIGLVAAGRLAERMGLAVAGLASRIEAAVEGLGLPVAYRVEAAAALQAMAVDKKRRRAHLRFVLPRDIGDVVIIDNVPDGVLRDVLSTVALGGTGAPASDPDPKALVEEN